MNTETQIVTKPAASVEEQLATLQAEVIRLRGADNLPKVPVTDAEFNGALAQLDGINRESLGSGSPSATPAIGLSKILNVRPDLTKEQKAKYREFKKGWAKEFTKAHRALLPQRKAVLSRVLRNGNATVSTVHKVRKDGTVSAVGIRAKEDAKSRKGKGMKKAKPAQVAAHVPAAGNAAKPAVVS